MTEDYLLLTNGEKQYLLSDFLNIYIGEFKEEEEQI